MQDGAKNSRATWFKMLKDKSNVLRYCKSLRLSHPKTRTRPQLHFINRSRIRNLKPSRARRSDFRFWSVLQKLLEGFIEISSYHGEVFVKVGNNQFENRQIRWKYRNSAIAKAVWTQIMSIWIRYSDVFSSLFSIPQTSDRLLKQSRDSQTVIKFVTSLINLIWAEGASSSFWLLGKSYSNTEVVNC